MKRERLRTVLFLVILLIVSLFVRLFFLKSNMAFLVIEGDFYQKAIVNNQGIYKLQSFNIEEIYTKVLSVCLLFLGNSEVAGLYLNIILQVLAVIILYIAIRIVANAYTAFLVTLVVSVIPFYSDKVYELSTFNLLILIYAIGLFILAVVSRGVYMFVMKKKTGEQEPVNQTADRKDEQTGVITLDDIIGNNNASVKEDSIIEQESQIEESSQKEESEVVPPGMKEIILDDEEKKKKVKFIENPLPVPKRREHKEMDFAVELRDNNDDYDIKDVSGMDYFDIE